MRRHLLTLALLLTAFPVAAQQGESSPLKIKFDIIGQGEIRRGGMVPVDSSAYSPKFIASRERLILDYTGATGALHWDARLTLQHSYIWGMEGGGGLKMYEAWGKVSGNNGLFLQVGRQALSYDDERIIGMNDWVMASQSHDVVRTGFESPNHRLHLVAAYNQNGDADESGSTFYADGSQVYKSMLIGWYHFQPSSLPLSASLLAMNVGMQAGTKGVDEHTEFQQLFGGYLKFEKPWLTVEGSYYRQAGHEEHGLPIEAWMAALKASWRPHLFVVFTAGYDYLSGDEYFAVPANGALGLTQHKVVRGFNPLYGSHHKFYGAMDFFYVSTYVGGFTPGLQNLYAECILHPLRNLDISLGYHYLAMATELNDMDMTLGHEIELEADYSFPEIVTLSAGFSYMTGTETMERLKRATDDGRLTWAWLGIRFRN